MRRGGPLGPGDGAGVLGPARAENLQKRLGNDDAMAETFWELINRTVHLEAGIGLFYANLSGGISSLTSLLDDSPLNQAIQSIGTGQGLVREVRFGLKVAGNEAFFNYLSDRLFSAAEDEVKDRVDNPIAQDLILLIMGELRPDLPALLGPDAKTWLRVEYGRFEGSIEDAWRFATRHGQPWFENRGAGWATDYFSAEAGIFPDGADGLDAFDKPRRRGEYGGGGFGYYLRYSRWSRPVVIGFGEDAGTSAQGYVLQDAAISSYQVGARVELLTCENFCWRITGTFAPFTTWTSIDLGDFGDTRGISFAGGFDVQLSLPINLFGSLGIAPYASFRADFLFPLLGAGYFDADPDRTTIWQPDYLLWGPTVGATGRF
ncbi:MAG: hypothetical protein R3F43_30515 [bacterium]